MIPQIQISVLVSMLICFVPCLSVNGQDESQDQATQSSAAIDFQSLPLLYETDFEHGLKDWTLKDQGWKIQVRDDTQVLSQFKKESDLKPKFRSPLHQALLTDSLVGNFQIDVRCFSTHPDYNHRDACLFFGYQSPNEFYYVHLGKSMDPHANQIFIVNNADRTKISLTTTKGTDWDDQWHNVRIQRNTESGDIKVFFDDMENPVMTANDKTFASGKVGVGSFDDTADWDDFKLHGVKISQ